MIFIIYFALFLIVFYLYSTRNHDYWSKRNVKHYPPIPLFGNHLSNQLCKKSITELSVDLYNQFPQEKVIGYYAATTPVLIVRDLDIARQILSADFKYFHHRGLGRDPNNERLLANLFHVDGDTWRLLRQRLTPAFTTAKLRAMFPLVVRCAERLQGLVEQTSGGEIDARELMARFTTEFIGACGFGIEMDTINNERSNFRELGKQIFTRTLRHRIFFSIYELFPELRKYLSHLILGDSLEKNVTAIVEQIRKQRDCKPIGRNDFIDLLLELEAKGKITGDSIEKSKPDGTPLEVEMEMDLKCQVAQVFIFFAAGFETSSSATSFALHKLAFNPDVQKKIQKEIDAVLSRYDNKLCYEAIAEMSLLDMAFKEAMRIFPSLGILNRVCVRQYTIPGLDITIDPGVKIIVPVQAIQMDEKYFDNPTEFRPERFTPEEEKKRHHYAYLPFGEGPRACIGARLGHMQSLAGLAALLHKFTVEPAESSREELCINHAVNVVQGLQGGLPLSVKSRKIKTV